MLHTNSLLLGTVLLILACTREPPPPVQAEKVPVPEAPSVPLLANIRDSAGFWNPTLGISGIRLGMTRAEVIAHAGTPLRIEAHSLWELGIRDSAYELAYPFGEVKLYGDRVEYVTCTITTCVTEEGLHVGSPLDSVALLYGTGIARSPDHDPYILYPDPRSDCGMTVHHDSTRVTTLLLWCDNS